MAMQEDIWYAIQATKTLYYPRQTLETFGATTIKYYLVSEIMDKVKNIRVREGNIYSERPQLILPSQYANQLLDGFGEEANEYANWLLQSENMMKIIRYGLKFRKDEVSSDVVEGTLEEVCRKVETRVQDSGNSLATVLCGADKLWEISLLNFMSEYVQRSMPNNFRQINIQSTNSQMAIFDEIEEDFKRASKNSSHIPILGHKLKKYNLFKKYEDRFFKLFK